jgi:D-3-phosphoglycerate dehydrogenase
MMKTLVIDRIHEQGINLLKKYSQVDVEHGIASNRLTDICGQYDILLCRATPTTPRIAFPLLENPGKLKVIGVASVGLDQFDRDYIQDKGIRLINLPGVNTVSVAEHTFALMLAMMRRVPLAFLQMKEGNWNKHGFTSAQEISGKTLGIIGLGNIGKKVAEVARLGFAMKVFAYDPYIPDQDFIQAGAQKASLEQLLRASDVVTIHTPLTKETYHMIGELQLKQMKQGAMILNLGRGGVIEENALHGVLFSGHLGFAALDVQEEEPCYQSPLFELSNFISTPHVAGLTEDALSRAGIRIVKETLMACGVQVDEDVLGSSV